MAAAPVVAFGDFEGGTYQDRDSEINSQADVITGNWYGYFEDDGNGSSGLADGFRAATSTGNIPSGTSALRISTSNNAPLGFNNVFFTAYQFIDTGNVSGTFELSWDYRRLLSGQADNDPIAAGANHLNLSVIGIDDTDTMNPWTIAQSDNTLTVEAFETSTTSTVDRDYVVSGANFSELASGGVGTSELDNVWYTQTISFNLNSDIDQIAIAIDASTASNLSVISYVDNVQLTATAVPEPGSLAVLGVITVFAGRRSRRRTKPRCEKANR